jgi:hypothetical protein
MFKVSLFYSDTIASRPRQWRCWQLLAAGAAVDEAKAEVARVQGTNQSHSPGVAFEREGVREEPVKFPTSWICSYHSVFTMASDYRVAGVLLLVVLGLLGEASRQIHSHLPQKDHTPSCSAFEQQREELPL